MFGAYLPAKPKRVLVLGSGALQIGMACRGVPNANRGAWWGCRRAVSEAAERTSASKAELSRTTAASKTRQPTTPSVSAVFQHGESERDMQAPCRAA